MPEQALQSLPPWYTLTAAAGICLSLAAWVFMIRRGVGGHRTDPRLPLIYGCALLGAIIGAKLSFLLAEAWNQPFSFEVLLSGKSITGALLLGYIAVEWAKRYLHYESTTGDLFAFAVPVGIGIGRIGCILQGCCQGVVCQTQHMWTISTTDAAGHITHRWPAAHLELAFQCLFLLWMVPATRLNWCRTNRFHVYLMAYGLFRFANEWMRDDARFLGPLSVYHLFAAAIFVLGLMRYISRAQRLNHTAPTLPA
jgi:phosphatidylglycerol:prolipoprotein diacylglycerol transferase